ncbi:MAG: ferritin-like domain-containing protein [bacterium]
MSPPSSCLVQAACAVLAQTNISHKAALARDTASRWQQDRLTLPCQSSAPLPQPPLRPGRPEKPILRPAKEMKRRRLGSIQGRIALLHAIAHIEVNAIDLAFDIIARFAPDLPVNHQSDFVADWLSVGDDEARHYIMLTERLTELGASYGDLPAHNGLWEAADNTKDNILARLSVAPLVLEARGLDVTPGMIEKLQEVGDTKSATMLTTIYQEEINHVRIGAKWLKLLCQEMGHDPQERFQYYVATRFNGSLKPPFNKKARQKAGLEENFYLNVSI